MPSLTSIAGSEVALLLLALASGIYLLLSLKAVFRFKEKRVESGPGFLPPISVLKPLCGAEPRLYECLRSFIDQDYPLYQVVFGVREAEDPAVAVVKRLRREFPDRDITLVVDARIHSANLKISNVMNIAAACRYDFLMVSDSDVEVGRNCFATVMSSMANPDIGLVSCIYKGTPTQGWVSEMGAININQWIVPSVLLDRALSGTEASLGPVLVVRRDALDEIGGFAAVSNYLAEDCEMGRRLIAAGWEVRLSDYTVATMVDETSLLALIRHEVRWAHTVRAVRPFDHLLSVVTCALPLLLILFALKPALWSAVVLSAYLGLRLILSHLIQSRIRFARAMPWWMVWPRECLCFLVWFTSLFSRAVLWRGQSFKLMRGGLLVPEGRVAQATFAPMDERQAAE